MTGKQLVIDAINNQETERTPWVPFIGCHAAGLLGIGAKEYFMSADQLYNGVKKSIELYRPDGIPALFDLQVEAEALGCEMHWSDENPPSVVSHPLENDAKKIGDLKMVTKDMGRFPIVLEAAKRICREFGEQVAIYGLITGPFTLALHLRGTDIFYDILDQPEYLHELMRFCEKVAIATADMYIDVGVSVVALVDPMTSQISPENFAEFVGPYAKNVFDHIKSKNVCTSFFVCGNAKRNVEEMCKCLPQNISIDENIPLDYVKEVCRQYGISFGGNIKLTLTMLFGTATDNIADAQNCAAIGGRKGYLLSPGCDIPFAVPKENIMAIASYVHGEIAEFMEATNVLNGIEYKLPDYQKEKKVIIDVITLDSASCAPCQYMMNAVAEACEGLEGKTEYIEHKIKQKESVVCMLQLGVSNLPTICIDGIMKFVSIIPSVSELRAEIVEAIEAKGL